MILTQLQACHLGNIYSFSCTAYRERARTGLKTATLNDEPSGRATPPSMNRRELLSGDLHVLRQVFDLNSCHDRTSLAFIALIITFFS